MRQRPLCAIRQGATGDITPTDVKQPGVHFAWYLPRAGIYMQTPIVYGDYLYACGDNGLLSCFEARTGKSIYRQRLGNGSTGFTASAVAADGELYFTNENGDIHVVQAGPEFELLAANSLNEVCMATPAVSDGMLIVRAENHVYAIGRPQEPTRKAPRYITVRRSTSCLRRTDCKCSRPSSCRPLLRFQLGKLVRGRCTGRCHKARW